MADAAATIKAKAPAAINASLTTAYTEKFTVDELKQLAVFFDSDVSKKYQQASSDLGLTMMQAVVKDTEGQINPKMQAFLKKVEDILVKNGAKKIDKPAANGAATPAAGAKPAPTPKPAAPK